jgi:hypothetical protein
MICEYLNTIEWGKKFYGMQEVIGSTPIFSTQTLNVPGVQLFSNTPGTNSATVRQFRRHGCPFHKLL